MTRNISFSECKNTSFNSNSDFLKVFEENREAKQLMYCLDSYDNITISQLSLSALVVSVNFCDQIYLSKKYPNHKCIPEGDNLEDIIATSFIEIVRISKQFDKDDTSTYPIKTLVKDDHVDLGYYGETLFVDF